VDVTQDNMFLSGLLTPAVVLI